MKQTAKRRGRPPVDRRRVPMTMRVTPALHDEIKGRAEATGRSLTQEAELLLEHAVVSEETMGSKAWRIGVTVTRTLLKAIDDAVEDIPLNIWQALAAEPLDNPNFLREGLIRSIAMLAELAPDNDIDGLFADARKRIEDRRSRDPGAARRKMAG